ncbi:MAG: hypothetical protein ACK4ZD_11805 [Caldimonas sp.]|uniref:hypothetical protein n=1 Tax=Caldimonas sp. TaxID=2838790 RepID=UPI00391D4932
MLLSFLDSLSAFSTRTKNSTFQGQGQYRERLTGLDHTSAEQRRAWIAFLAAEGAFMLRHFGLVKMNKQRWRAIAAELRALLASAS